MNKIQSLMWSANADENKEAENLALEEAFVGVLKTYVIAIGTPEINLLNCMHSKQKEVDNVNQLDTQAQLQKVLFSDTIEPTKLVEAEDSSCQMNA